MAHYQLRKVHSCEFCGTEEQPLGAPYPTLDSAKAAAEQDANRSLTWAWFLREGEWPLFADPEDDRWQYHIHSTG